MATPYEKIYSSFLQRVEMEDFNSFTEDEQNEMLLQWMNSALGYIELNGLDIVHDLSRRDDTFEEFEEDLKQFEIEIIALYMVVAWYEPRINGLEHTLLMVGSSGEKWTNQQKHWTSMVEVRNAVAHEARALVREYRYRNNDYLDKR